MDLDQVLNYKVGSFMLGRLLTSIVIFVIGYVIIKCVMKFISKLIDKTSLEPTFRGIIKIAVKAILYFILALIVADNLGINTTSFIAMFSVVGLAFSLAVENVLANVAGGIILAMTKPFHDGDYVQVGSNNEGVVEAVRLVYTRLRTMDNKIVHIPNGTVTSSNIVNYTEASTRRIDLTISASYDTPVQTVHKALMEAADAVPGILPDPAPFVNVKEYGDSSISYYFRVWVKSEDYWPVNFALTEEVKAAFDRNGVEMTYNHLNVHLDK